MTFDDYRDKIIASLAAILLGGIAYISIIALGAASKADVEVMISKSKEESLTPTARNEVQMMINEAKQNSIYMQDKSWIHGSIQDLNSKVSKSSADVEKNRDMIELHHKTVWDELARLRVEIERVNMWRQFYEDEAKKKGMRAILKGLMNANFEDQIAR